PHGHEWEPSPALSDAESCPQCGATSTRWSALPPLSPPSVPDPPIDLLSRAARELPHIVGYEILEELGHGGMGVVYKARHQQLDRLVAVKVIRDGELAGPEELSRFRAEAAAVARMQHPNIVQIHDIGEYNRLPYFTLEFCAGGSLEKKL